MSPKPAKKSAPANKEKKPAAKQVTQELEIEVVADVVCPWCYLGWARLKKALELRPGVKPALSWRAYQLDPSLPPEGADYQTYMTEKFKRRMGKDFDPERIRESRENLAQLGREDGITFNFDKIKKAVNTNGAHRLIRWAAAEGKLDEVADGVMRAYFTEGRFIGDEKELIKIGVAAGMDAAKLKKRFATDEGRDEVLRETEEASDAGVSGVPFYRLGGNVTVEGSWPAEDLVAELDKALAES
jgi:predicted DsbA family dithiol-disulfide isomerase